MYKKLHRKLTFFCTVITCGILIAMSALCLWFSERELILSDTAAFESDINSMISYLETQSTISSQWLARMENGGSYRIYLTDNGVPFHYNREQREADAGLLCAATEAAAAAGLNLSLPAGSSKLTRHLEFTLSDTAGQEYRVSVARSPRNGGILDAIILYPQAPLRQSLLRQRLFFVGLDVLAALLLGLFSCWFTKKQIRPLEESRRRQTAFIAAASHELRSPLTIILSSVSALRKSEGADRERFARAIESEGKRMSRLVDDLLLLAGADNRSWSVRLQKEDPETLLLTAYERFEPAAREKKQKLTLSLPEEILPAISCDKERMAQIFSALLDNALEYTPAGGEIHLSLCLSSSAAASYEQKSHPSRSFRATYTKSKKPLAGIEFRIANSGSQIPPEDREHIFERFYRADSARHDREHFGLGLCIVKEIVELHRGEIWVEDWESRGIAFVIRMPATTAQKI